MRIIAAIFALTAFAGPAFAQSETLPACRGELAPFGSRTPAAAAANSKGLARAPLSVGKAIDAKLVNMEKVGFGLQPEQAPPKAAFGGMYNLSIATAGTYRIALSGRAWIDVVRNGKMIVSTDHGEKPCAGIQKAVEFPLTPGTYSIQLSGSTTDTLGVLVARKP